MGQPREAVLKARISALDDHCRTFIAKCSFVLIASADREGRMGTYRRKVIRRLRTNAGSRKGRYLADPHRVSMHGPLN
jgi:hypothetical protein